MESTTKMVDAPETDIVPLIDFEIVLCKSAQAKLEEFPMSTWRKTELD